MRDDRLALPHARLFVPEFLLLLMSLLELTLHADESFKKFQRSKIQNVSVQSPPYGFPFSSPPLFNLCWWTLLQRCRAPQDHRGSQCSRAATTCRKQRLAWQHRRHQQSRLPATRSNRFRRLPLGPPAVASRRAKQRNFTKPPR